MGQAIPRRQILIVDRDEEARHLAGALFEESDLDPIECDTAADALRQLETVGDQVVALFVDLDDAGPASAKLFETVRARFPWVRVIATGRHAGQQTPADARFMRKPWLPLDLLIAAETTVPQGRPH
ncbi:response regulator [Chthonobacter rhizosphaerae]|uniref:response regulator n=1 Tax=Chthonobacter rhizosphaerae TaxID=2735553 RepID=UPI0015EFD005|nr:response regulator [Chthonobacter rhizosphaerae]